MVEKIKCGLCDNSVFFSNERKCFLCERCGAQLINNEWKKICADCKKETDKLFDLFVPHHCKECSEQLHKEAKEKKDYCLLCGVLRMDCCC